MLRKIIPVLFKFHGIPAFLLCLLLTGTVLAQSGGSRIFISDRTPPGKGDAAAVSDYLASQIGKGLMEQCPCVDWLDNKGAAALLEWERGRELLTGELDEAKLQALAGALNSRYLIVVNAETLPNGQTIAFAKVIDTRTGQAIVNRATPAAKGDEALDNVESLVKQMMQDLSGLFNNQCDPRWTGTITYAYKRLWEESESKNEKSASMGGKESRIEKKSTYSLEHSIVVQLIASPVNKEHPTRIKASVQHRFDYRLEETSSGSWQQWCRAPGVPGHWKPASGNYNGLEQESGTDTAIVEGFLIISRDRGSFDFEIRAPDLKTKWIKQESGVKGGCESEPFSNSETKDDGDFIYRQYTKDVALIIQEKFDPQNPDVIAGSKTEGTLEDGRTEIKWSLRLIKPKKK